MPDNAQLTRTLARFDAVNAGDPRQDFVDGQPQPRELVYARRMSEMLDRFEPNASEPLRLAARSQHIARWEIPRSDFPEGREGYKRWRSTLMRHHAEVAAAILRDEAYDEETVDRVSKLLRKQGLKRDPEVQTLEDVVCLVFLQYYFEDFARDHEEAKVIDIVRKTWGKMSERGHAAALELDLTPGAGRLVKAALEG